MTSPTHPLLLTTILTMAGLGQAQDWAQFRGPGGQGIAKADSLPPTLTAEHIRWRAKVGAGHSSPVVHGDRIYLTQMGDGDGKRDVVCLDRKTGKAVWSFTNTFEPHQQHRLNSFASATPAVDDTGVYVYWSSGGEIEALAIDLEGEKRWQRTLGKFRAQHGSGASPILHGGHVIVANENEGDESFLLALDKATGKTAWRVDRESSERRGSYSCPIVYPRKDQTDLLLFASQQHGLTAVDAATGNVAWELDLEFQQRCVATPCVAGDLVFISAGAGGSGRESAFVEIPATADGKPKIRHRMRRSIPYVPCALVLDGRYYMFNDGGVVSCVKAADGDVVWRKRVDGSFFSSPVSNGKTIYIADRAGVLHSLTPGDTFRTNGTLELGGPVNATPAIAHETLYVRTDTELIALGATQARKIR